MKKITKILKNSFYLTAFSFVLNSCASKNIDHLTSQTDKLQEQYPEYKLMLDKGYVFTENGNLDKIILGDLHLARAIRRRTIKPIVLKKKVFRKSSRSIASAAPVFQDNQLMSSSKIVPATIHNNGALLID